MVKANRFDVEPINAGFKANPSPTFPMRDLIDSLGTHKSAYYRQSNVETRNGNFRECAEVAVARRRRTVYHTF